MNKCYISAGGCEAVQDHELKMLGELLIASYNAYQYDKLVNDTKKDTAIGKHTTFLRKAAALKAEAELHRLLSCLYESGADRPLIIKFLDEVFDLLK